MACAVAGDQRASAARLSRVKVLIGCGVLLALPLRQRSVIRLRQCGPRLVTLLGRSRSGGDASASIEGCSGRCGWLAHPPTGGSCGDVTLV